MTPSVAVITYFQADGTIGLGHAVRLKAILDSLPFESRHVAVAGGDGVEKVFPGCRPLPFDSPIDGIVADVLTRHPSAVLIVDHPAFPQPMRRAGSDHLVTVIVNDQGGPHMDGDLIVNPSACKDYHHYPDAGRDCRLLLGPAFLPLRPEFGHARELAQTQPDEGPVGFVLGSGARAARWFEAILDDGLPSLDRVRRKVVLSPTYPDLSRARNRGSAGNFEILTNLSAMEMVRFYRGCRFCALTAGMGLYEALASETAVMAYSSERNMPPEVKALEGRDALVNLGAECGAAALAASIEALLNDPRRVEALRRSGGRVADGRGAERIGAAIAETLKAKTDGRKADD